MRPLRATLRSLLVTSLAAAPLVAVLLTAPPTASAAEARPEPFVVGGAPVDDAPWAAAVLTDSGLTVDCSGALVAASFVLTSADCAPGSTAWVRVGSVTHAQGGTTARVVETFRTRELALLRLDVAIATGHAPLASQEPPLGSTHDVFGWGESCGGCGPSPRMRTASVRFEGHTVDEDGVVGLLSRGLDGYATPGDEGGPQFYEGRIVGVVTDVGVLSGHHSAANVARSRGWILAVAGV
ncbi:trypsin-like serine protease [Streptomyces sp. 4N509B]|uniref:trypsin-like serine protease n=1 Tax=Streptomyces sp. 4N509B TaxID=3457413 RepID=UPI003FD43329